MGCWIGVEPHHRQPPLPGLVGLRAALGTVALAGIAIFVLSWRPATKER